MASSSREELALPTAQALREGGPWGPGFPEPLFDGRVSDPVGARGRRAASEARLCARPKVAGSSMPSPSTSSMPRRPAALPSGAVRLVYRLDSNEYLGERRLQFVVEHLLPA